MPLDLRDARVPAIHSKHGEEAAAGVPQGSMLVVGGGPPADAPDRTRRLGMRQRKFTDIARASMGPLESHWTADEMRAAADRAAAITRQEHARQAAVAPPEGLSAAARADSWALAKNAANTRHLLLGVAGLPPFAQLPYFRYEPAARSACCSTDLNHELED